MVWKKPVVDTIVLPAHAETTDMTPPVQTTPDPCPSTTGFSGNFAAQNWMASNTSAGNGTVDTNGAPGSIIITSGALDGSCPINETLFCITIPCSGTISFDWNFDTDDVNLPGQFPFFEEFGTNINSTFNSLANSAAVPAANAGETVNVNAGDVFCFSNMTNDCQAGPGITTISNFSFTPS